MNTVALETAEKLIARARHEVLTPKKQRGCVESANLILKSVLKKKRPRAKN